MSLTISVGVKWNLGPLAELCPAYPVLRPMTRKNSIGLDMKSSIFCGLDVLCRWVYLGEFSAASIPC